MALFKRKTKDINIYSPMDGEVYSITETDDKAFASKMMGDGVMIRPTQGTIYAPCDATIEMIFPTKHAMGLRLKDQMAILLHFGLDTVELNGQGFEVFVENGQKVSQGDPLMKGDLVYLKEHAKDNCLIVVFTEINEERKLNYKTGSFTHEDIMAKITSLTE